MASPSRCAFRQRCWRTARSPSKESFRAEHRLRWVKSGAAPLAPELARRFTASTGVPIRQGYGMTEASPVTHMGFLTPELYRPDSVGAPVAETDCRVVDENGQRRRAG